MMYFLPRLLLALGLLPALFAADTQKPGSTPAARKSAIDKATLEAYVRHLFVWGPQIKVEIDEPKPSQLPGFVEMMVHASAGTARQDEVFYVSKDGQKIVRGVVFDIVQNPFKSDLDKIKTEFQPSFGTPGAPVVLVVFSDFQCPYCKEEAKMLRTNVLSAYPKQVRVYFKDLPLEQIHPWAKPAAIAGRCVFRQNAGAFWQYHDWIFENQGAINAENLKSKVLEFAQGKEIDALQLGRCMDAQATEAEIAKSVAEAQALRVMSTPTLFVNGRRIASQIAWPDLRQIIDFEIEYQKTAKNAGEDCGCEVKLPAPAVN
ncbi:MAG: thioredoxin domain-containing protein [Bryobacteraceae bacterium]